MTILRCQCALIVAGLLALAGCGSSSSTSSAVPPSTPTQTTTPSQSSGAGATGTSGPSAVGAAAELSQAIQRCKQQITASTQVSASVKAKLESLCDEAASGNAATLKKTAAQVCQELVNETVPADQRAADLAKCPKT